MRWIPNEAEWHGPGGVSHGPKDGVFHGPTGGVFETSIGVDWQPSVLAPVFYGHADYDTADGAPGPVRVFYPSVEGSPAGAPILHDVGRYPLVLFMHGQCNESAGGPAHYLRWDLVPMALARSGYVVAVPRLASLPPFDGVGNTDVALADAVALWMRASWQHAGLLMPRAMTAIVGHSWGALAGAVLAQQLQAQGAISAFASLSGGFVEWPSVPPVPLDLSIAAMFQWGTGSSDIQSPLPQSLLRRPQGATHTVSFRDGEHFDYFTEGTTTCGRLFRGTNALMRPLAADLVVAFLSHYMPPQKWAHLSTTIPHSLVPPPLQLTAAQQFFAGGHLQGFAAAATATGARVEHIWRLPPFGGGSIVFGAG